MEANTRTSATLMVLQHHGITTPYVKFIFNREQRSHKRWDLGTPAHPSHLPDMPLMTIMMAGKAAGWLLCHLVASKPEVL